MALTLAAALAAALAASTFAAAATAAPIDIKIWRHETDDSEMKSSAAAVERFNQQQHAFRIVTETLPHGSYQQAVIAAAMTKKLPCVLDLDQPTVPNFAWAGHIQPLEGALRPAGANALIPGGRSTYKGKLYAVGQFDVALAMFARRSVLAQHGIRLATLQQPYSATEFRAYSLDRGRSYTAYAGNPVIDIGSTEFRDPKVFWHAPTHRWVMLVVAALLQEMWVYTSADLKAWAKVSSFGPAGSAANNIWEVPELFELPVADGGVAASGPPQTRWVLVISVNHGAPVGFLGALSSGFLGQRLLRALLAEGVGLACAVTVDAPTTLGLVGLDASGSASYSFYGHGGADRQLLPAHLPVLTPDVHALHFGSYTMVVEPVASTQRLLVERERATRVISYDPNLRLNVEPDLSRWTAAVDWMARRAHLLKVSAEDLALLCPGVPVQAVVDGWLALGVALVVVTDGGQGATAFTQQHRVQAQAGAVALVDTVGAGDSFQAAMLAWLAEQQLLSAAALRAIGAAPLQSMLDFAAAAAAITCSRRGADLPRRHDLPAAAR